MKRTLLIAALFLGFSATSFADEAYVLKSKGKEVIITDKQQVSETEYVYKVRDIQTGMDYNSLPTQVQIVINTHGKLVDMGLSGNTGEWGGGGLYSEENLLNRVLFEAWESGVLTYNIIFITGDQHWAE